MIIYSVVLGIMLFIIAFNYTINPNVLDLRSSNPIVVFIQAFTTRVDTKLGERFVSLGLFWMVVFVVLVGTVVALLDIARSRATAVTALAGAKGALISLAISLGMFFGLGLVSATIASARLASSLADRLRWNNWPTCRPAMLPNSTSSACCFCFCWVSRSGVHRGGPGWLGAGKWLAPAGGAVLAVVGLLIIFNLNASLVRADIIYKQGQAYDNAGRYTEAIQLYQMAIDEGTTRGLLLSVPGTGAVGAGACIHGVATDRFSDQRPRLLAARAGVEPVEHGPLRQSGPALPGLVAVDHRPGA